MHVSIAMDGVTQQVFAQKMTRIHVYAGHVNIICVLKKNQSLLKEPLRIICLMELNLLRCILLHFNDFNLYSFCPLISLVV